MKEIETQSERGFCLSVLPTVLMFYISTYLDQSSFFIWFRLCSTIHSAMLKYFGLSVWDFSNTNELHEIKFKSKELQHCKIVYLSNSVFFPRNAQWLAEFVARLRRSKSDPEVFLRLVPSAGEACEYASNVVLSPFIKVITSCSLIPLSFASSLLVQVRSLSLALPCTFYARDWGFVEKGFPSLTELVVFQNSRKRDEWSGTLTRILCYTPKLTHLKINIGFTQRCFQNILKHCKSLAYVEITLGEYCLHDDDFVTNKIEVHNGLHYVLRTFADQLEEQSSSRKLVIHIDSSVTQYISPVEWELWEDLMRFSSRMEFNTNLCLQWDRCSYTQIDLPKGIVRLKCPVVVCHWRHLFELKWLNPARWTHDKKSDVVFMHNSEAFSKNPPSKHNWMMTLS